MPTCMYYQRVCIVFWNLIIDVIIKFTENLNVFNEYFQCNKTVYLNINNYNNIYI